MDNRRQRPFLGRACKKVEEAAETVGLNVDLNLNEAAETVGSNGDLNLNGANPLHLNPSLWRKLPVELAYKVLSFLPMDRCVETLQLVNRRWEKFLQSHAFLQIFGHGKNLNSSYGFVIAPNHKVPKLSAFEHESMKWRQFPRKVPAEVKACMEVMDGSSNGLFLCESKDCRVIILPILIYGRIKFYPDVGVWNPILHSFKWLPIHPELTAENLVHQYRTNYLLMVDEPSRTYKVFLEYHLPLRGSTRFYSVYSNTSRSWSVTKPMPEYFVEWNQQASCDRYIFFEGMERTKSNSGPGHTTYQSEYCLFLYDAHMDSWNTFLLSKILSDLGYNPRSTVCIESLATLEGRLYLVLHKCGGDINYSDQYILASLDQTALGCGFEAANATFNLETMVPDTLTIPPNPSRNYAFNLYTFTMKSKGFLCVISCQDGRFLCFDLSSGVWLPGCDKLRVRNWKVKQDRCFSFKPSLVVP